MVKFSDVHVQFTRGYIHIEPIKEMLVKCSVLKQIEFFSTFTCSCLCKMYTLYVLCILYVQYILLNSIDFTVVCTCTCIVHFGIVIDETACTCTCKLVLFSYMIVYVY